MTTIRFDRPDRSMIPARVHHPEVTLARSIDEDGDERDWLQAGVDDNSGVTEKDRKDSVANIRWLSTWQPNVKQALRLYESYVLGRDFTLRLIHKDPDLTMSDRDKRIVRDAQEAWQEFLHHNRKWWTIREFGRRVWRDGEQFTRKFAGDGWPPQVRFVDPEDIDDPGGESMGIVTSPDDVAQVQSYLMVDREINRVAENIPADEMFHTKIDVDSTEKRGLSRFLCTVEFARMHRQMVHNEVDHRNLQSSIVIQRRVNGSPGRVQSHLDNLKTGTTKYVEGTMRREKIRRGTIVTVNQGVDLEFKQPQSNFSDASPLARLLILQISAATGWPYFMVAADSSDSNFASNIVQESPVSLMVQSEQDFFRSEILDIWQWVMMEAIASRRVRVPEKRFFETFMPHTDFPSLVQRDILKEAQVINLGIMNGTMSVQEGSRQQGLDPDRMALEIEEHIERGLATNVASMNTVPDTQDPDNNTGTNQGNDGSQDNSHDDAVT